MSEINNQSEMSDLSQRVQANISQPIYKEGFNSRLDEEAYERRFEISERYNIPLEIPRSNSLTDREYTYSKEQIRRIEEYLSSQMFFNPKKFFSREFRKFPQDESDNWDLDRYLECVEFNPELLTKVNLPGFDFKSFKNIENPASLLETDIEKNERVALLLLTEAMLNTSITGIRNAYGDTLETIIDDVHPDWRSEIFSRKRELRKILEISQENKGKNSIWDSLEKLKLNRGMNKKQYERLTATLLIVASALTSCGTFVGTETEDNDPRTEVNDVTNTPTPSKTSTPTQTSTPTKIPTTTETPTPTASPTPIIEGDIEIFTEEMENEVVLPIILELQGIINNYNPAEGSFTEYIEEQKKVITNERMLSILNELSQVEEFDDIELAHVLQKSVPELDIVPFSPWPESMYEVMTTSVYEILSDPEKYPFKPNHAITKPYSEEKNIWVFFGDWTGYAHFLVPGDLMVNTDTFDFNKEDGFQLYILLGVKEHAGEVNLLLTTVNDNGKIELIVVSESESMNILGKERWLFWGRSKL